MLNEWQGEPFTHDWKVPGPEELKGNVGHMGNVLGDERWVAIGPEREGPATRIMSGRRKVRRSDLCDALVDEGRCIPLLLERVCAIADKPARLGELPLRIDGGQAPLGGELCDLASLIHENGVQENHECTSPFARHRRESAVDLLR